MVQESASRFRSDQVPGWNMRTRPISVREVGIPILVQRDKTTHVTVQLSYYAWSSCFRETGSSDCRTGSNARDRSTGKVSEAFARKWPVQVIPQSILGEITDFWSYRQVIGPCLKYSQMILRSLDQPIDSANDTKPRMICKNINLRSRTALFLGENFSALSLHHMITSHTDLCFQGMLLF